MWTPLGYTIGAKIHLHQSRNWHWSANARLNAPYIVWPVHFQYTGEYPLRGFHTSAQQELWLWRKWITAPLVFARLNAPYIAWSVHFQYTGEYPLRGFHTSAQQELWLWRKWITAPLVFPWGVYSWTPATCVSASLIRSRQWDQFEPASTPIFSRQGTMAPFTNQQSCLEVYLESNMTGTIWIHPFLCNLITTCTLEPCLSIITCENPKIWVRVEADPIRSCEHTWWWRRIYIPFNNIEEVTHDRSTSICRGVFTRGTWRHGVQPLLWPGNTTGSDSSQRPLASHKTLNSRSTLLSTRPFRRA